MSSFRTNFNLLALTLLGGCALASKGDPLRPRYFEPMTASSGADAPKVSAPTQSLRLGRIDSSAYLREAIAFRDSAEELGHYETLRWTEKPELYLRREFERSLFEEQRFVRALTGDVPTLEAELLEFSEDRAHNVARVRVAVLLHDEQSGLLEHTITVERPIGKASGDNAAELVRAMAAALHEGVDRATHEVVERLRATISAADAATTSAAETR